MVEVKYGQNSHLSKDSGKNNIGGGLVVVSSMMCWQNKLMILQRKNLREMERTELEQEETFEV